MIEVRTATSPAPGRLENEDAVFRVGDLVGVLDGVTQADGVDSGCVHGVAWYVRQLVGSLCQLNTFDPSRSLTDLLRDGINTVRDAHPVCDLSKPSTPAATVCLVRTGQAATDYLVLCDTTLVIEADGEVTAVTDHRFRDVIAELRSTPVEPSTVEAVDRNRGYTAGKWNRINRPGGYWIAAATPEAADHAITGSLPMSGPVRPQRIAMLTDGAACAVDPLGIMTWPMLLKVLTEYGAGELIRQIRAAEVALAENDTFAGKLHDDATTALLLFPEET